MSLRKQLIFVTLALFGLLFLGTFCLSSYYTRHYLAQQLESNTQDTAISLGLSLTTVMEQKDKQHMLAIIQAVFNSGYYTNITIANTKGESIVERSQAIHVYNVPQWFTQLIPLHAPTATSPILSGWKQIGEVKVTGHPGYAYIQLWRTLWGLLGWFLLITFILSLLALAALRKILRPLHSIEQQAHDICQRKFTVQEKLPTAKELKPVVMAMNKMSLKIKGILQQQTQEIQHLNKEIFVDNLTRLNNRNYLYHAINDLLLSKRGFINASIAILDFIGLEEAKREKGFQPIAEILKAIAINIKNSLPHNISKVRLDNHSFAFLFINEEAKPHLDKLIKTLPVIREQQKREGILLDIHCGIYTFKHAHSVSEIMSAADNCLRQAQKQQQQLYMTKETTEQVPSKSAGEWLAFLEEAIAQDAFSLYFQPVKEISMEKTIHYEVFLRVKEGDTLLPANQFFPYAELFDKAYLLDKLVIEKITVLARKHPDLKFAINLSNQTLIQPEFHGWFAEYIKERADVAKQIIIEVPETYITTNLEKVKALIDILKTYGAKFGVDNFGRSFSDFGYLQTITPDYIKFLGAFSAEITEDTSDQFFIKSIVQIAHSLDCMAIACNVENESQLKILQSLNVDGLQGYLIGRILSRGEYF